MSNLGFRDLYFGSARQQLIEELQEALKQAQDQSRNDVDFKILDHEINYHFDTEAEDIEPPAIVTMKRQLLCEANEQRYFLEPNNNGMQLSRYNEGESRLERLVGRNDWVPGAYQGKVFLSIGALSEYFIKQVDSKMDCRPMARKARSILGQYASCRGWCGDL